MTVPSITNVKVSIYNDSATLFCLSWEHDCAHYHVWVDRHTYMIEPDPAYKRPTLYKNPPQNVRVGMDGYFRTRKIDARKHGIVDTVLGTPSAPGYSKPPSPRSKHANATKPTGMLARATVLAPKNKCLAKSNKSGMGREATKKRESKSKALCSGR